MPKIEVAKKIFQKFAEFFSKKMLQISCKTQAKKNFFPKKNTQISCKTQAKIFFPKFEDKIFRVPTNFIKLYFG